MDFGLCLEVSCVPVVGGEPETGRLHVIFFDEVPAFASRDLKSKVFLEVGVEVCVVSCSGEEYLDFG